MKKTSIKSILSCTILLACLMTPNAYTIGQNYSGADVGNQFYAIDEARPNDMATNMIIHKDARYIGGMKALRQHMMHHVFYQEDAVSNDPQGKVLVRCTISPNGTVSAAEIVRSFNPVIDSAIINAVLTMPRWEAAIQYGRPVESTVIVPYKINSK